MSDDCGDCDCGDCGDCDCGDCNDCCQCCDSCNPNDAAIWNLCLLESCSDNSNTTSDGDSCCCCCTENKKKKPENNPAELQAITEQPKLLTNQEKVAKILKFLYFSSLTFIFFSHWTKEFDGSETNNQ
ncbi:unnamed protein product [Ceutorhynchus assimilis]|uniref:Uncharacterized protein n=1 Tax=Ceutorhynchus assimilis TaxID=467358 RepID=A0A9N9MRY8_9CUCU|nr:unnamed protein product [Ceutorhynchus assimilis]